MLYLRNTSPDVETDSNRSRVEDVLPEVLSGTDGDAEGFRGSFGCWCRDIGLVLCVGAAVFGLFRWFSGDSGLVSETIFAFFGAALLCFGKSWPDLLAQWKQLPKSEKRGLLFPLSFLAIAILADCWVAQQLVGVNAWFQK